MIFKKKIDPIKETIRAKYSVQQGIRRLEVLMDKIMTRRRKMLDIAAQLEARGETFLAKKYAAEIAKLDKIHNRLANYKLVLEKIDISLEYTLIVKKFHATAHAISELLSELKKLPETTIPEIGLMLAELEHSIKNLEETENVIPDFSNLDYLDYASSHEIDKIIEEARAILKEKLETGI